MSRWLWLLALVFGLAMCGSAVADILVTLEARVGANPVDGPVEAGTEVTVEVFLAVTEDDDPLGEVRSIQFDFRDSDDGLELTGYEWLLAELGFPANYFLESDGPIVRANYIGVGNMLELSQAPVRIGRLTLIADDDGTLDVSGEDAADEDNVDEGLRILAGITSPREYSVFAGDVAADTLDIEVEGSGGGGNGNDNGNSNDNGNTNDNGNGNDNGGGSPGNDNDGRPPVRNEGPKAQATYCGFASMGPMLLCLSALGAVRVTRAWRPFDNS